jgi:Domain of unknown function (DUF4326)
MIRIRLSRTLGWKLPPGARSVAEPTRWANPHRPAKGKRSPEANARAVELYRTWLAERLAEDPGFIDQLRDATALACWCQLDLPCHVDVLLERLAE